MGVEIERKFLVSGEDWKDLAEGVRYAQGYLNSAPERTVRVRIAGCEAFLTVKGRTEGVSRAEYEYPIPVEDAKGLLALCERPIIEKVRRRIPFAGLVWEVDAFEGENAGLVVAEVELPAEDAPFEKPEWVGEEVSGDPRYFNSNLVREPYSGWK